MRHLRPLVLSLIVSLPLADRAEAQGEGWTLVGTTDDTTYYIDSASVATSSDHMLEVRTKSVYARTIVDRFGKTGNTYDARTTRYRVDCAKGLWRGTETTYYRGSSLVSRITTAGPRYHAPRWPQDKVLLEMACRMEKR